MTASFLLYWKVVAVDGGWLALSDDNALLSLARTDGSLGSLLLLHNLHFIPAMRLTFLVMYLLFDTSWTPYSIILILSHSLLAFAVAAVTYRFGRSAPVALVIALPLVTSWSLSSGVLTSFIYFNIYMMICLIVISPILVEGYLKTSSKFLAILLFFMIVWCIFTLLSGFLIYVSIVTFYVGLKYVLNSSGRGLRGVFMITRHDLVMVAIVVLSLSFYALAYGYELSATGWKLPVEISFCDDVVDLSPLDRYLYVLSFGYFGFFSSGGFGFLPWGEVGWHRFLYAGLTIVLFAGSLFTIFSPGRFSRGTRLAAVVVAGFLFLAMLAAAMVISGRACVQLWHMRYNAYALTFIGCAVGVMLGHLTSSLPARVALIVSVALIAVSVLMTYHNVQAVLASPWMVNRAPGFLAP